MKMTHLLAVLLLILPALVNAEAYELNGNDIKLPISESGEISFKGCDNCNYQRARLAADVEYSVDGEESSFERLREALSEAPNRGRTLVTVITEDDSNRIRLISIRIR